MNLRGKSRDKRKGGKEAGGDRGGRGDCGQRKEKRDGSGREGRHGDGGQQGKKGMGNGREISPPRSFLKVGAYEVRGW